MWGSPRRWHVSRAAMTASGEQQARSALGPAGSSHRRSVTPIASAGARSSATALSTPPLIATATRPGNRRGAEDGRDRVRERIRRKRLAGDGCGLEQGQPGQAAAKPRRVCLDDPLAVEKQADDGVVLAAGGVADQLDAGHAPRLA